MAKVFTAPDDVRPPEPDYSDHTYWQRPVLPDGSIGEAPYAIAEREYLERLAAWCRRWGARSTTPQQADLIGEVISFQRGDGYAQYMVLSTRPLQLIWIQLGDAWSVEDALLRGLTVKDVRAQVERERKWRELFEQREAANA